MISLAAFFFVYLVDRFGTLSIFRLIFQVTKKMTMKKIKFTIFILLVAAFFVNAPMSYAVKTVTAPVSNETTVKTEKKGIFFKNIRKKRLSFRKRFSNWKQKIKAKILKKGIDLEDPIKKWLWYAILALGGSFALWLVAVVLRYGAIARLFYALSGILSLLSLITFVIWLIKAFG